MLLSPGRSTLLVACMLVGMLTGCARQSVQTAQPEPAPLNEWPTGTWVLQSSDVAGLEAPTGGVIEISFETGEAEQRVTGYGGCNRFSGSARFGAGSLALGPLVSTKRACVGEGQAREHAYFKALIEVSKVFGDGADQLRLQLEDGRQLQFQRRRAEVE